MTFLSLLAAFVLEQLRPHRYPNSAVRVFMRYADRVARFLNAGQASHGALGWGVAVVPPVVAVMLIGGIFAGMNALFEWIWNVVVLYFTVGFRQVSHTFTGILRALRAGETELAKKFIAQWRQESALDVQDRDIAKLTIEEGLRGAHRYVFAPVLFMVLAGPAGAVFYRLVVILGERWTRPDQPELAVFGGFAREAFKWIDWLPSRLTAAGFAIAGNFEDAYYCWRTQAQSWPDRFNAAILASGAGALGVRLGGPLHRLTQIEDRPVLGLGEEPGFEELESTVGLLWRATVIWMLAILLWTVARWMG